MGCKNIRSKLSAYLDGELGSREYREVKTHLAECASCSAALEAMIGAVDHLRRRPVFQVPESVRKGIYARLEERRREGSSGAAALFRLGTAPGQRAFCVTSAFASFVAVVLSLALLELVSPARDYLPSSWMSAARSNTVVGKRAYATRRLGGQDRRGRDAVLFASELEVVKSAVDRNGAEAGRLGSAKHTGVAVGQEPDTAAGMTIQPSSVSTASSGKNIFHKKLAKAVVELPEISRINSQIEQKNQEIDMENQRIAVSNDAIRSFNEAVRRQNELAEARGSRSRQPLVPLYMYMAKIELADAGV